MVSTQKYAYVPLTEELKEKWISDPKYTEEEEKDDLVMSYLKFSRKTNFKPN